CASRSRGGDGRTSYTRATAWRSRPCSRIGSRAAPSRRSFSWSRNRRATAIASWLLSGPGREHVAVAIDVARGSRAAPHSSRMTTSHRRIALATSAAYADLTDDDRLVIAPLRARGVHAEPAVWDDPAVRWD